VGASSEPPAKEPKPPSEPAQRLAGGHLHPGILFLRLLFALKQTILPLILAAISGDPTLKTMFIAMSAVAFLLPMVHSLIRYLTFQYVLTTEELITTEGILHRRERRIPVNRIQDLSFEQTLVRRFVGLVVVTVETASGEGGEARLDSLGLRSAGQLRVALQHCREQIARGAAPGSPEAAAAIPAEPTPGVVLFKTTAGELLLRGLTDNRFAALFVAVAGLYEMADQFGLIRNFDSWIGSVVSGLGATVVVLLLLAVFFVALLVGWVVSVIASFLLFHDFTLIQREGIFQRRYGLFTTRTRSLPQRKIQRVLLEQNWVRRLLQMAVVRADSAGSGAHEKQEAKGGLDVVAPLTRMSMGRWLVAQLLPGLDVAGVPWQRVSPKVVQRMLLQGTTAAVLGGVVTVWFVGPLALLFLLLPLITWGIGALMYTNLGYAHLQDHFCLRWGVLGRYRAMIPLKKVQAVTLRAGPEDRLFGLARLSVYVAGCGPTTLDHLTRADAELLRKALADSAAASKFVW